MPTNYMPKIDDVSAALGTEGSTGNAGDYHVWGNVKSVNDDGSYQVQLNTSTVTTRCARGCSANTGDRVLVVIKRDGKAVAAAVLLGADDGYLRLSGGRMLDGAQVSRSGRSASWYNGRDCAMVRQDEYTGYNPIFSAKTATGTWDAGTYESDGLYFTFISDQSYSSGSNVPAHQYVMTGDGRLLLDNRSVFRGTVLYANTTGTTGTVTLSQTAANFAWVRIFYRDNDWFKASIDVHAPNGSIAVLSMTSKSAAAGSFWHKTRAVSLSGAAISTNGSRYGCCMISGPGNSVGTADNQTNNIYITAVVGYNT